MTNTLKDSPDYVLGTDDEELQRLGLQHDIWRPYVLDCWQSAGIVEGKRILDVGAGPGYATRDLAKIVGAKGRILALEQSAKYMAFNKATSAAAGFENIEFAQVNLMEDVIPAEGFDAAWVRWVTCFVPEPEKLVKSVAASLKKGGKIIFHDYIDYGSWKASPPEPMLEEFVQYAMKSWRDAGGEPDIGRQLPRLLAQNGFEILEIKPYVFCTRPDDEIWPWTASFIEINLERLKELGHIDVAWAEKLRQKMQEIEADPNSLIVTPMVVQIIAEKL